MSEPYVGEIRMFAGSFAPRNWAFCDGQLLAVSQNDALFSLFGTIYGGDGRTTFGLPDLRGRIPIHAGSGPGLSSRPLGQKAGQENVAVTVGQLPTHSHPMSASTDLADASNAAGKTIAQPSTVDLYAEEIADQPLAAGAITNVGGSQSHTNLQPALCVSFIVALFGIYPSRS